MLEAKIPLNVSDLKQHLYCARITYFNYVMPVPRKTTYKMVVGKQEHFIMDSKEERRTLTKYGLADGQRIFHEELYDTDLNLQGTLDLLISSSQGLFPVEFKYSTRAPLINHKYQVAAYGMLAEAKYERTVNYGFIYLIPLKKLHKVFITDNVRTHVKRTLSTIRKLIVMGRMPLGSRSTSRCKDCEFRRYCADLS